MKINMAPLPFVFIFLCLHLHVNSEVYPEAAPNAFDSHAAEISAVLNHLNSSSFKVYNYKEATLLHAHTKADITELALEVDVECVNKYPDIPCTEKALTCHAFVRSAPEGSQVLNDVNCKPKPEVVVEEASYEPPTEVELSEPKSVALSNEAVSSEVAEPFVAVRKDLVPCLGCPFEVNPQAEGVDELVELALEHVGSERANKQALVRVLKVQQQVVSGVKYTLVAELGPTVCSKDSTPTLCPLDTNAETAICEITYLQKPWISKSKHIIANNCTTSQEYVRDDDKRSEMSNEIDINGTPSKPPASTPNFDHIAESGNLEMSPSRLSDLESQILLDIEETTRKAAPEAAAPSVVPSQSQIDERFQVDPTSAAEEVGEADTTTPEAATERTENKSSECSSEEESRPKRSEESAESDESNSNSTVSDSSEETSSTSPVSEAKNASSSEESAEDSVTESPNGEKTRRRRAIPQLEKISQEEKPLVKNLADFAAAALDNIDDDNHKRIILQILGAKKMVGDDGVYYHLIMRMGISRCLEDRPPNPYENCRDKLFENYTKICKVQVYVNDDFTTPKVVKSQCQNIKRDKNDSNRTNYSRFRRAIGRRGGQSPIDTNSERVKGLVREGLDHLNARRDTNKHKSVEVISATSQVVAGSLVRIKTKIVETECSKNDGKDLEACNVREGAAPKECLIKVWEKPWEDFKQFTITCDGDQKTYEIQTSSRSRRHVPNSRPKRGQTRPERYVGNDDEVPVAGGESSIDKNSERVKNLLRLGLNHLNAQRSTNKHKLVEVVSATDQVVAGSLVRIKTKIVETECSKNDGKDLEACDARQGATPKECLIKVWEKPWENFREFTITCDDDQKTYKVQSTYRSRRQVPDSRPKREVLESRLEAESSGPVFRRFERSPGNDDVPVLGGQNSIDKNSERVQNLLHLGLNHLNAQRSTNKHKSVEVVSATEQVVAGSAVTIRTKIVETECSKKDGRDLEACDARQGATPKECLIKVWEKPWEKFRDFTITCDGDEKTYKAQSTYRSRRQVPDSRPQREVFEDLDAESHGSVFKRSVLSRDTRGERLIGGASEIDKNSERVQNFLRLGLDHLNAQRDTNKHKSVEVISATRQVVAGTLVKITTKIAETECPKNDARDLEACNLRQGATPKECVIKVWEKPWQNFRQFTITCDGDENTYRVQSTIKSRRKVPDSRPKREALGVESVSLEQNNRINDYLEDSLNQLDAQSPQDTKYKVHQVLSVTRQVVAGHLYRIKANVVLTDCKKTLKTPRQTCDALDDAKPKLCHFKIYEALWIPNSRSINITCDDDPEPLLGYSRSTELLGNDDPSVHFALFNHFIAKYNKKYSKKEFKYRFKVFSDNLYHIRLLNRYEQGTATYGITQFADMTQQEFSKSRGLRPDLRNDNEPPFAHARIPDIDIPQEFDWRKKGAVSEVKNQQQCGSCWAFSVTGNVEGQYAIKHGKLLEFSEQELVDCDTEDQGCNGGLMDTAYRQIEKLGGLETEQDYPYDAEDETCHFNRSLARVQLSGAVNISQDEGDMAKWLVANGPISIAINANAMQFYFGGISHPFKFLCSPKNLDHGVLIVGYGVHTYPLFNKTMPYWIVKNSWGTSWGEQGYYRVYRGDGTCGLNQTPSSAIVV